MRKTISFHPYCIYIERMDSNFFCQNGASWEISVLSCNFLTEAFSFVSV